MKSLRIHAKGEIILGSGGLTVEGLPDEFQKTFPEISPKYVDNVSLLAGIAAGRALNRGGKPLEPEMGKDFAVIVGSAFGAVDSMIDFDCMAILKGPNAVNPMDFPNTVANAAGSRIGIWLQLKGPNVTLTNGGTSFIDALGFAWEGYNNGLFQRCLVGAAEKVPLFLKPLAALENPSSELREGACFLLASGSEKEEALFEITDYFSLQLRPDLSLPPVLMKRFEEFWGGVEWLSALAGTPLKNNFPQPLVRFIPSPSFQELGLGGFEGLNHFLSVPQSCGVLSAFSKPERKVSFIKINKKKRSH